jgi:hypothetical protein
MGYGEKGEGWLSTMVVRMVRVGSLHMVVRMVRVGSLPMMVKMVIVGYLLL